MCSDVCQTCRLRLLYMIEFLLILSKLTINVLKVKVKLILIKFYNNLENTMFIFLFNATTIVLNNNT